ncbi:hypothetical protein ACIHCM_34570 [Streptomyces sp. NPDC052023]|uniref:hypothetical protein n=1 Tax=Streptomyces sp. NPDC052023 TaxID=3365681 RepID=UPI0037CE4511
MKELTTVMVWRARVMATFRRRSPPSLLSGPQDAADDEGRHGPARLGGQQHVRGLLDESAQGQVPGLAACLGAHQGVLVGVGVAGLAEPDGDLVADTGGVAVAVGEVVAAELVDDVVVFEAGEGAQVGGAHVRLLQYR